MKNKNEDSDNTLVWVLAGAGIGVGLYFLLRPKASAASPTLVMPVPSTAAPLGYATLGAVSSRFDDLRDIYHMGKLTPEQAMSQVDALKSAVADLTDRGVGDKESAYDLMSRLEDFKDEIIDFVKFKASLGPQA